jgi:hypothetical protein
MNTGEIIEPAPITVVNHEPLANKDQLEILHGLWETVFVGDNKAGNMWAKGVLGKPFNPKNLLESECDGLISNLEDQVRHMPTDADTVDADYDVFSGE